MIKSFSWTVFSRNAFLIRQGFLTWNRPWELGAVYERGRNAFLIRQGFLTWDYEKTLAKFEPKS